MDEVANADQAAAWDGDEGEGWALDWERYDQALATYRDRILTAAAVTDGERILDVGCGNGESTRDVGFSTPSGTVLGVDLSSRMLDRARQLTASAGLSNIKYVQADAQVHRFGDGAFDLALSKFGSMFFADKVAAFANIRRALCAGGRLLLVVWQPLVLNEQFSTIFRTLGAGRDMPTPPPDAPSPFGLADPEIGNRLLRDAGFVEVNHESVNEKFSFGPNAADALAFVCRTSIARGLLGGLDDGASAKARDALHDALRAHETSEGVLFNSATWFISARNP